MNTNIYNKLIKEFTSEEQIIFIDHFKLYLNYDQDNDFIIDLDKTLEYIEYNEKDKAKKLLLKYCNKNEDFKIISNENIINKGGSGLNKETILMTPNCFKYLCMRANTNKAQKIRKYYIKMETLYFKLIQEELNNIKELQDKLISTTIIDTTKKYESSLIRNFSDKPVVYICMLLNITKKLIKDNKILPSKFIIKIGHSHNFKQRFEELKRTYNESELSILEIYEASMNKTFEQFLHKHTNIKPYNIKIIDSKIETYSVTNEILNNIKKIINDNINNYKNITIEQKIELENNRIESKKFKLNDVDIKLENVNNKLNNLENDMTFIKNFIDKFNYDIINKFEQTDVNQIEKNNLENISITSEIPSISTTQFIPSLDQLEIKDKIRNVKINAIRTQMYNMDTLEYIRTFNTRIDVERFLKTENKTSTFKQILFNSINNRIYKGYRWLVLNKKQIDEPYILKLTEKVEKYKYDMVCKIDPYTEQIVKVYSSILKAKDDNNCVSSAISRAIIRKWKVNNYLWLKWSDVKKETRDEFIQNGGLLPIEKCRDFGGKKIMKININTNEREIYNSIQDILKNMKISRHIIKESNDNNISVNGYLFKYIE